MKKIAILLLSINLIGCSKQIYIEGLKCSGYYEYYELDKKSGFLKVKNSKNRPEGLSKFIPVKCDSNLIMGYKWVYNNKIVKKKVVIKKLAM